jgi:protocatechuate 3,4-dioxygenase, alpha subunit
MSEPMTGPGGITPSQTVGPYLRLAFDWPDGPDAVPEGTPGAIVVTGLVYDGNGDLVPDAVVETWQADAAGRFDHADDPRGSAMADPPGFRGFGRCPTDGDGRWWVRTVKPGALPAAGGGTEAPHLDVSVFARGLLDRVVTRLYFPEDTEAHRSDPVLAALDEPDRAATMIATAVEGGYSLDIRLQGRDETVFFDV